jgi:hypothetical protein
MKTIKLINSETDFELDLNIKDSWSELTLMDYFNLTSLVEKKDDIDEMDFVVKMLVTLSDAKEEDLIEIPITEFEIVMPIFTEFSNLSFINVLEEDFVWVDGVKYIPKKNMSSITSSELMYIKQIQKNSKEPFDLYLGMLSILLRPGFEREEDGKTKYVQYRLDISELESRKELFKKHLKCTVAVPLINFFLSGMKK